MKGVAHHGNTPFDVPYISEVGQSLWQGGCETGLILPNFIKHVVSLYPWERYRIKHRGLKSELYVEMFDSVDQGFGQIDMLADWINLCRGTGPVLVHCQAGLNRSSLVAARALFLADENWSAEALAETGRCYLRNGAEIIDHLRASRSPAVLCNPAFEAEVRSWT